MKSSKVCIQGSLSITVYSGLIEHNPDASTYFQPKLVLNDSNRGRKILEFVLENLEECTYFRCAVALITRSGDA